MLPHIINLKYVFLFQGLDLMQGTETWMAENKAHKSSISIHHHMQEGHFNQILAALVVMHLRSEPAILAVKGWLRV